MTEVLVLKNVYKVFGEGPDKALALLKDGFSKEEILAKTGLTIGVHGVSLTVQQGEVFVLMGLSGSGKSTLLRCINSLIKPTSGEILIHGENIATASHARLSEIRRKKISMVFQRFALFPHRTVLDNVAYGLEIQGIPRETRHQKAREMLEVVGLSGWEKSYPSQLSGVMHLLSSFLVTFLPGPVQITKNQIDSLECQRIGKFRGHHRHVRLNSMRQHIQTCVSNQ
jgi:glycine betaine/proline transport system ATP-binding protein